MLHARLPGAQRAGGTPPSQPPSLVPSQHSPRGSRAPAAGGRQRLIGEADRVGDREALPLARACIVAAAPIEKLRDDLAGLGGSGGASKCWPMFRSRKCWTRVGFNGFLGLGGAICSVLRARSPLCISVPTMLWRRRAMPLSSYPTASCSLGCSGAGAKIGPGLPCLLLPRLEDALFIEALRVLNDLLPALGERCGRSALAWATQGASWTASLKLAPAASFGGALPPRRQESSSGEEARVRAAPRAVKPYSALPACCEGSPLEQLRISGEAS
mmetsp:Transcript_117710/g.344788  ORF Transcript_117710/g.344788 Transcript_117710/m.344788 type:complete len:272 (-) Transcript_117710:340-1155(-)